MLRRLIVAALATSVAVVLSACGDSNGDGFTYDEGAHREAVKAALGVAAQPDTVESATAWQRYKAEAEKRCGKTGDDYEALVAVFADERMLAALRLDAEYMCPDKLPVLNETLVDLGYPPGFGERR